MFYAVVINHLSRCDMKKQRCHDIRIKAFVVSFGQSQSDSKHLQLSLKSIWAESIQQVLILSFEKGKGKRRERGSVSVCTQKQTLPSLDYCPNCCHSYFSPPAVSHWYNLVLAWYRQPSSFLFNHLSRGISDWEWECSLVPSDEFYCWDKYGYA